MALLALLLLSLSSPILACPRAETMAPLCECKNTVDMNMMFCRGLLNPDELVVPIRATAQTGIEVHTLAIENSSLLYVPSSIFRGTTFQKIRFLSSEIMALSDTDEAFSGLENQLTEIRATDAHYITQWDWQQLRNLKKLELIDVNYIEMGSIDQPFPDLPELRFLGIIRAEISFIVDFAFQKLPSLIVLNMKSNDISELKRSMLPEPALGLSILDFSDNELTTLPEDFFKGMPSLETVKLDQNKFVTLSEKTFSTVLDKLQELTMTDNDFRCDCRLRWMAGVRVPFTFSAYCAAPESLAGIPLKKLDLKSLWCW